MWWFVIGTYRGRSEVFREVSMNLADIFNLNADTVPVAHGQRESSSPVGLLV